MVHQGRKYTKNYVLNPYNNITGIGNYVVSTKPLKTRYLFNIIPIRNLAYITRNHVNIPLLKTNHNFFENSFSQSTIIEWNNLNPNLRNSDTYGTFENAILKFIRPSPNSVFECRNPQGIKFLTRLRFDRSHLHEHKFKHSF